MVEWPNPQDPFPDREKQAEILQEGGGLALGIKTDRQYHTHIFLLWERKKKGKKILSPFLEVSSLLFLTQKKIAVLEYIA